jgi:trans-2,3-dihydro-3-hydroxyanthranilate isomerase
MRMLPYEIVDVFTDRPFTGNPLAVVYDGQDLSGDQMQALAREFHLSETVFVLPPKAAGASYLARIFTPEAELPFAGHPSIGAAVCVAKRGGGDELVQECGAGLLPITVGGGTHARLTGGQPTVSDPIDPAPLLEIAGLEAADFVGPAPRWAGCGLAFPFLSVSADSVARGAGDAAAAARHNIQDVSVFHWDGAAKTAHTRVFVPGLGVPEDPATGSAALGFGVWLVASGLAPPDGDFAYTVHQGIELQRPSTLDGVVTAAGGTTVRATISGGVVAIARGTILVPPFIG